MRASIVNTCGRAWLWVGVASRIGETEWAWDHVHDCRSCPLTVMKNWLQIGGVLHHRIMVKISPKAASEKAQAMISENRYIYPMIDVFRTVII